MGVYRQRTYAGFDPSKQLVAGRQMMLLDALLQGGDKISMDVDEGIRRRLWMVEHAHYEEDWRPTPEVMVDPDKEQETESDLAWMDPLDGVTVTEGENGWYDVKADWAAEAEKVHGADAARERAIALREAGDDKGVTITHTGGGWYEVKAPWVEEAEKVQGKEAAEARADELRQQAPPPTPAEAGGGEEDAGA